MQYDLMFNGKRIQFGVKSYNFREYLKDDNLTDSLVWYDPETNSVIIDERADVLFYGRYAGMHETICLGPYSDLAPKVENSNARCFEIDKMLIDSMDDVEKKREYIKKRIEMHQTILDKNLNPALAEHCKYAIDAFKKLLETIN